MSDKYAVPNKLPGKTVSVLTHRKRRLRADKAKVEQKIQEKTKRLAKVKQHHKFRRAESFVMNYLKAERTAKRIKHTLWHSNVTQQAEAAAASATAQGGERTNTKLLLVMRHAGKKIFDKTTDNIFKSLHMIKRHNAIFLENNKENQILLKVIEPFVVYGFPSVTTIRELLFKKGFARVQGRKTPIQSNTMIEEQLGDKGIICLEDIVHEIFTVGPNFEAVQRFLCIFQLQAPRDGWKNKVSVSFKRGGEYGDRGTLINDLIARCI